MPTDHLGKGEPGIHTAAPLLAIGAASLFRLRRVYAVKADALARNVDSIAVDDARLARDLGMGHEWGYQGERKKYKAQEHGVEVMDAELKKDPAGYVRVVATMMPKDVKFTADTNEVFLDVLREMTTAA